MNLPQTAVTLAPDQVAGLSRELVSCRHNVNNHLTLTMGLRYNLELSSVEEKNQYVYLDLASASPLQRALMWSPPG